MGRTSEGEEAASRPRNYRWGSLEPVPICEEGPKAWPTKSQSFKVCASISESCRVVTRNGSDWKQSRWGEQSTAVARRQPRTSLHKRTVHGAWAALHGLQGQAPDLGVTAWFGRRGPESKGLTFVPSYPDGLCDLMQLFPPVAWISLPIKRWA